MLPLLSIHHNLDRELWVKVVW